MARYIFNPVIDAQLLSEKLDMVIEADGKGFVTCQELYRELGNHLPFEEDGHTIIGFFKSNRETLLGYGLKPHRRAKRGYLGFKLTQPEATDENTNEETED